jgi:hypothetical protein
MVARAREKRLREAAEERRMKELRKKAQEDAEEEERQRVRYPYTVIRPCAR